MKIHYQDQCPKTQGLINQPVLFCPYCGDQLAEVTARDGQLVLSLHNHGGKTIGRWSYALVSKGNQLTVADRSQSNYVHFDQALNSYWTSPALSIPLALPGNPFVHVSPLDLIKAAREGDEIIEVQVR